MVGDNLIMLDKRVDSGSSHAASSTGGGTEGEMSGSENPTSDTDPSENLPF